MRRKSAILFNKFDREKVIIPHISKKGNIVYGARSILAQLGIFARPTEDWDIFSTAPKKDALTLQEKLDRQIGFDYFYSKPGMHKGTHKVKGLGFDMKKETSDDESIADFTQMPKPVPSHKIIRKIRYRTLSQEIAAKKKAAADPAYAFRKEKDEGDLRRIKSIERARNFRVAYPRFKK